MLEFNIEYISNEIRKLYEKDQEVRKVLQSQSVVGEVDKESSVFMKDLVRQLGDFPRSSVFGQEVCHKAWCLVQHCDDDLAFQKKCLAYMKALPKGEVWEIDIAYLEDRVLVAEGKKQLYGTQFYKAPDGKYHPCEISNLNVLRQRRLRVGLEPFDEYRRSFEKLH